MEPYSGLEKKFWPDDASLAEEHFCALHAAHHEDPAAVLGCKPLDGSDASEICPLYVFRVWHQSLERDWELEMGQQVMLIIHTCEEPHEALMFPMTRRGPWLYEAVLALPQGWLHESEEAPGQDGVLRLPRYRVFVPEGEDGQPLFVHDTYAYSGSMLTEEEVSQLQAGLFPGIEDVMGCHCVQAGDTFGLRFVVWAPQARFVSVVGNWNDWDGRAAPMRRRCRVHGGGFTGLWELLVPFSNASSSVPLGSAYGFRIHTRHGNDIIRIDPFAQEFEVPSTLDRCPDLNSSIVSSCDDSYKAEPFRWSDEEWLSDRDKNAQRSRLLRQPMAIYEVHLPSWRRGGSGELLNYRSLAQPLIEHLKATNFNYVELIGLAHHPYIGSWGYQVTGYFSSFSLLGSPDDLKFLIDSLHRAGIGVIMDFVPAHFCKDACGFSEYDGCATFEYSDPREGEQKEWGTKIFNYSRNEVRSFIIGSALFWAHRYHIDGFRCDAVSCMIYRNFGRADGEWIPNVNGGDSNLEAVSLLRELNKAMKQFHPGVLMIAEESTAWEGVTSLHDCSSNLGFDLKWDLGWMNDTLVYLEEPAGNKHSNHDKLTFRARYMQKERYVSPLSHDEVANMKGTLVEKMGRKENLEFYDRLCLLRALYGYQAAAPGRVLLFMGQEFAQGREWNCRQSLDWHEGGEPQRQGVCVWVSDLLGVYQHHMPLYAGDDDPHSRSGRAPCRNFDFVENNAEACVLAFCRHWQSERPVMAIFNFGRTLHRGYTLGSPYWGGWQVLLNSDDCRYGGRGTGPGNLSVLQTGQGGRPDCSHTLTLDLPAGGCVLLLAPQDFEDCHATRLPPGMGQHGADPIAGFEFGLEDLGFD
eukprot:TRINITY_DN103845_c0_g1_i1.p1 TRINITY_DN103845_c0_g1~~TRINITY_DN103845_c0_g1_i1.p1  ORF type:complete len:860 (+),score=104.17 TRINITY_DN103845_c0_g1_i1:25-2604(+)